MANGYSAINLTNVINFCGTGILIIFVIRSTAKSNVYQVIVCRRTCIGANIQLARNNDNIVERISNDRCYTSYNNNNMRFLC